MKNKMLNQTDSTIIEQIYLIHKDNIVDVNIEDNIITKIELANHDSSYFLPIIWAWIHGCKMQNHEIIVTDTKNNLLILISNLKKHYKGKVIFNNSELKWSIINWKQLKNDWEELQEWLEGALNFPTNRQKHTIKIKIIGTGFKIKLLDESNGIKVKDFIKEFVITKKINIIDINFMFYNDIEPKQTIINDNFYIQNTKISIIKYLENYIYHNQEILDNIKNGEILHQIHYINEKYLKFIDKGGNEMFIKYIVLKIK